LEETRCLDEAETNDVKNPVSDFVQYLDELHIKIINLNIDWSRIHDYCLRYSLETPDATHLLIASDTSDFLTTIDTPLKTQVNYLPKNNYVLNKLFGSTTYNYLVLY
jgi:hypothetical protein